MEQYHLPLPAPPSGRRAAIAAAIALVAGALLLVAAFSGLTGGGTPATAAVPPPPPVTVPVVVPAPAPVAAPAVAETPVPARGRVKRVKRNLDVERFAANDTHHVRSTWVAGFYPLYEIAAKTFGVNWLLIASIHKQETGFSTHPTTYRGLNFAGCCGGPMQFNITNGPVSTWDRFKNSFKQAERPARYNHRTAKHPSLYDDFDTIMAAGALLKANGAGPVLDVSSWRAAYLYYGLDLTGVGYADQVMARAIGWGRKGFCINCELDLSLQQRIAAAWGDPVRADYERSAGAQAKAASATPAKRR